MNPVALSIWRDHSRQRTLDLVGGEVECPLASIEADRDPDAGRDHLFRPCERGGASGSKPHDLGRRPDHLIGKLPRRRKSCRPFGDQPSMLFRDSLPDEQRFHDRLVEFGVIDAQRQLVWALKREPPSRGSADRVGILIDVVASIHIALIGVDLESGAVRVDTPERNQRFLWSRAIVRLPSRPVRTHGDVTHVPCRGVKKGVAHDSDAVRPLPCGAIG